MATVTIDGAGRVLLPKAAREALGMEAGDKLEVTVDGEGVSLRPVRSGSALEQKEGIWVVRTGRRITREMTNELVRRDREGRGG